MKICQRDPRETDIPTPQVTTKERNQQGAVEHRLVVEDCAEAGQAAPPDRISERNAESMIDTLVSEVEEHIHDEMKFAPHEPEQQREMKPSLDMPVPPRT